MTSHRSHPPVSALRERMIEDITVRGIGEKTRHDHTLRHSFATHCWSRTSTPTPIVSAVFPMALAAEIDRSTSAHQLWRRRRARLPPCGGRCAAAPLAAKPLQPTRDALARALDALETLLAALADRDQLGLDLAAALDRQADRIGSLIAHCGSSLPSLFLPGPRFCPWSGIRPYGSAISYGSLRCSKRITGTSARLSLRAARSRPWPARMPPCSSTRTGLVQPNSTIDAAIWSTCTSECVRGLRSYGRSRSIGQSSIRSASATSPAPCGASVNCEPRGANLGANLVRRPSQASQLRTSVILRLSAGSSATGRCEPRVRRGATPGSHPSHPETQEILRLTAVSVRTRVRRCDG